MYYTFTYSCIQQFSYSELHSKKNQGKIRPETEQLLLIANNVFHIQCKYLTICRVWNARR